MIDCIIDGKEYQFDAEQFSSSSSTYIATETVIEQMKGLPDVELYAGKGRTGGFLYNNATKTAVYLKFVLKLAKKAFVTKRNKSYKNPEDIAGRITTTAVARQAIFDFMNQPEFEGFDLVVPAGHHMHETCIFLRKEDSQMRAIYFNPNWSVRTNGPEKSYTSIELMQALGGKQFKSVQAFTSDNGNVDGKCSLICWEQIFHHIVNGQSPFKNEKNLVDFSHFVTPNAYNKYHFDATSDGGRRYKHFALWKELDDIMVSNSACESDVREISAEFSEIVCAFHGDE